MNFRFYPFMKLVTTGVYRNIAVPMCGKHLRATRRRGWISVLMRSTALTMIVTNAFLTEKAIMNVSTFVAFLLAGIVLFVGGERMSQYRTGLRIANATRNVLYFRGAGGSYLSSLPHLAGTRGN